MKRILVILTFVAATLVLGACGTKQKECCGSCAKACCASSCK